MKKKILMIIMAFLMVFALAACGSSDDKESGKETETTTVTPKEEKTPEKIEPTGNVVEVNVKMTNFQFDTKEIKAKAGDTIKLTVANETGGHGFAIDEFGVDVKGGETVEFIADQKGEFEYYCSLMCGTGHDNMVGKLIVE
jgi:heme/copper-type cytochrome/quinol oxidase subunit 2